MSNFINNAVGVQTGCHTCGGSAGQEDFFGDLLQWWNDLEPIYKYAIIGGAGLVVVVPLLLLLKGR